MMTFDDIKKLPPNDLLYLVKFSMWAVKGEEEFGLEFAYLDDEIIMFRRKAQNGQSPLPSDMGP